jgi:hypothetical protein
MTIIIYPQLASSTPPPMRDRLASAANPRRRSLVALAGMHGSASLRRLPRHTPPPLGAASWPSTTPQPLESP